MPAFNGQHLDLFADYPSEIPTLMPSPKKHNNSWSCAPNITTLGRKNHVRSFFQNLTNNKRWMRNPASPWMVETCWDPKKIMGGWPPFSTGDSEFTTIHSHGSRLDHHRSSGWQWSPQQSRAPSFMTLTPVASKNLETPIRWTLKTTAQRCVWGVLIFFCTSLTGWWLGHPSEKYESQLGWWFPIYGKIKMSQTTNQLKFYNQFPQRRTFENLLEPPTFHAQFLLSFSRTRCKKAVPHEICWLEIWGGKFLPFNLFIYGIYDFCNHLQDINDTWKF